jgi:hypothetical protein
LVQSAGRAREKDIDLAGGTTLPTQNYQWLVPTFNYPQLPSYGIRTQYPWAAKVRGTGKITRRRIVGAIETNEASKDVGD